MHKKNIIIGVISILVLLVLGWLLLPSPPEDFLKLEVCEESAEIDPHCIAMVRNDPKYCDGKPDQESIDLCYYGSYMLFAVLNDDILECEKIEDENRKNICIAITNEDISLCEKSAIDADLCKQFIKGEKPTKESEILGIDSYYLITALKNKDILFCEKLINRNDADMCKAILTGDEKYCKDMIHCYDQIYSEIAINKKNQSICNNIQVKYKKEECIEQIALKKQGQ